MRQPRDYRTLDKDLRRISQAEIAGFYALRPLHRIGLALIFLSAVALLATALMQGAFGSAMVLAGFVVAAYLALNIGANDVANSAGAAIGAGVIPLGLGLALVALSQIAGALLGSAQVKHTIATQIIAPGSMGGGLAAQIMLSALISAALWVNLAVWLRAPVSTTHSVIGGIAGAGIAAVGPSAVHWPELARIASAWVAAPFISAMLAAGLFGFLRWRVHFAEDRRRAALFWLPLFVALAAFVFALYLGWQIAPHIGWMPGAGAALALCAWAVARWHLHRLITRKGGADDPSLTARQFLTVPLVMAAMMSGFAHGANDLANVAGPLSVLLQTTGPEAAWLSRSVWLVLISGCGIALGSMLFGRNVVQMVGSEITRLNAARAFAAVLAAASTVIGCSALGLPVSTTHCAVAGVFGIGFYREREDRLRRKSRKMLPSEERRLRRLFRRSHVWTIVAAWVVTLPSVALLSALCLTVLRLSG